MPRRPAIAVASGFLVSARRATRQIFGAAAARCGPRRRCSRQPGRSAANEPLLSVLGRNDLFHVSRRAPDAARPSRVFRSLRKMPSAAALRRVPQTARKNRRRLRELPHAAANFQPDRRQLQRQAIQTHATQSLDQNLSRPARAVNKNESPPPPVPSSLKLAEA